MATWHREHIAKPQLFSVTFGCKNQKKLFVKCWRVVLVLVSFGKNILSLFLVYRILNTYLVYIKTYAVTLSNPGTAFSILSIFSHWFAFCSCTKCDARLDTCWLSFELMNHLSGMQRSTLQKQITWHLKHRCRIWMNCDIRNLYTMNILRGFFHSY